MTHLKLLQLVGCCLVVFIKMDIRNFYKNTVVSSSEVRVSEDISETHEAEDNATQISGINNETDECSVAMATIQKRRECNV